MNGTQIVVEDNILLKSHEKRLINLEVSLQENTKETVACKTKIEALGQQLVESNSRQAERIAAGFERVFEKLDDHRAQLADITSKVTSLGAAVGQHQQHIGKLQEQDMARKQKRIKLRKRTVGILLATIGGIATAAGEWIWALLTHR